VSFNLHFLLHRIADPGHDHTNRRTSAQLLSRLRRRRPFRIRYRPAGSALARPGMLPPLTVQNASRSSYASDEASHSNSSDAAKYTLSVRPQQQVLRAVLDSYFPLSFG